MRVISSALIGKLMDTIRQGPNDEPGDDHRGRAARRERRRPRVRRPARRRAGAARRRDRRGRRPPTTCDAQLGAGRSDLARAVWREQIEASHGVVIYVADPTFTTWTDECVQAADIVVFVACGTGCAWSSAGRARAPAPAGFGRAAARELVLLHDPTTSTPRGTRHWLARARASIGIITFGSIATATTNAWPACSMGLGVGVVFSGGGARGHRAHRRAADAPRARRPDRRDRGREHRRDRRGRGRARRLGRRRLRADPRRGRRQVAGRPHVPERLVRVRARASRITSRRARRASTSRTRGSTSSACRRT